MYKCLVRCIGAWVQDRSQGIANRPCAFDYGKNADLDYPNRRPRDCRPESSMSKTSVAPLSHNSSNDSLHMLGTEHSVAVAKKLRDKAHEDSVACADMLMMF